MTDFQVWKQRREELLREAEMSHQARALRATHKRRDGQRSALVWEMKRYAGGLLKLLRALRICRLGTEEVFLCGKEVLFPCRTEERLAGSFLKACLSGDMEALLSLLSVDMTLYSGGRGKARAALKPIHGADRVARLLLGVLRKDSPESIHIARVNGQPGMIGYLADGRAAGERVIEASEGRIGAIRFVLNPEKLSAVPPLGQVERKEVSE